jgi:hypothetical protein
MNARVLRVIVISHVSCRDMTHLQRHDSSAGDLTHASRALRLILGVAAGVAGVAAVSPRDKLGCNF